MDFEAKEVGKMGWLHMAWLESKAASIYPVSSICEGCGSKHSPGQWCSFCCSGDEKKTGKLPPFIGSKPIKMRCPLCSKKNAEVIIGRSTSRSGFDGNSLLRHIGKSYVSTKQVRELLPSSCKGIIGPKVVAAILPEIVYIARAAYKRGIEKRRFARNFKAATNYLSKEPQQETSNTLLSESSCIGSDILN
mmetsp:Transcript_20456/g.33230  ORF Transcript_20456/g.33230 Transcript_20456/m.33230 type:complete len:191 (+) Transcript_20456:22-594(+)